MFTAAIERYLGDEQYRQLQIALMLRPELGASQTHFAMMIGVSVATLRNWEHGRRTPDGPALALLRVAARHPKAVIQALHTEPKRGAA